MEQEQKSEVKTTNPEGMPLWQLVVGLIAVIGTSVFIWNGFIKEDSPQAQQVREEVTTEDFLNSPKVSERERSSALSLVAKTVDKDWWMRSETARTYEDVYKNPKGDGYVVWLSDDKGDSVSYTFLVKNDVVYAIAPDARLMAPSVSLTTEVTIDDLSEIKEWRLADYSMRYIACMRHANILERNGVVEKRVVEQRNKCEAQYN